MSTTSTLDQDQDQTQNPKEVEHNIVSVFMRMMQKATNEATREQIALRILADLYAAGPTRILQLRHPNPDNRTPKPDLYVIVCSGDEHLPFVGEVRRQIGMRNEAPPLPADFHDNDPDGLG